MFTRPPLRQRILSRVYFYSALLVFLWIYNQVQTRDAQLQAREAARALDEPGVSRLTNL